MKQHLMFSGANLFPLRVVSWFIGFTYWMTPKRRTVLSVYVLTTTGYSVIVAPVSMVLADQIGPMQMGVILSISSLCALPGYHVGGWLNNRFGSHIICRIMLPIYLCNLGVFLLLPSRLPAAWVVFGFVNGIVYVAIDALFRQSVDNDSFAEGLAWRRTVRQHSSQHPDTLRKQFTSSRFATAFSTSALISYISAGVGAAVGIWIAKVTYVWWILLVIIIVGIAYVLIWQVEASKPQPSQQLSLRIKLQLFVLLVPYIEWKKREPRTQPLRVRLGLYGIAIPYLGITLANTAFLTFLPLSIGVMAGVVLMIARITNGLAYLPAKSWIERKGGGTVFRWSVCALGCGILLIPIASGVKLLSMGWFAFVLYLLTAVLIGFSVSCSKLVIQLQLQQHAPEGKKGSATTPLAQTSELGFLIGPVVFGALAESSGGFMVVWLVAAVTPLLSLALQLMSSKRE